MGEGGSSGSIELAFIFEWVSELLPIPVPLSKKESFVDWCPWGQISSAHALCSHCITYLGSWRPCHMIVSLSLSQCFSVCVLRTTSPDTCGASLGKQISKSSSPDLPGFGLEIHIFTQLHWTDRCNLGAMLWEVLHLAVSCMGASLGLLSLQSQHLAWLFF